MILVIDNYDSFTYNLIDMLEEYDEVVVRYPDDADVLDLAVDGLVISPGPGHPLDNGHLTAIIRAYEDKPILGICLGSQALTCHYGGEVVEGTVVKHGKMDEMRVVGDSKLYKGLGDTIEIMRYHSLVSDRGTFPADLRVTGETRDSIQSFEHIEKPHFGIQYHPESFACDAGSDIIRNYIEVMKNSRMAPVQEARS
ncbi:anthranilate synthase component II [Salinicoccus halitifaciens]|uniref:Anthranilate synthase component 2 n=1 Tax=Salinicoccus halitifaciens TaxID=1073415 RepID=A0ABV2EB51_9STAP|nr:aminodeoxychorismate/anthranilate synthase component II [Salinicoccus halitifaciens]MCD2138385.1 aminodeoxychorismate/anthranilate synthase component II [Salinicoccus halitifaciens]